MCLQHNDNMITYYATYYYVTPEIALHVDLIFVIGIGRILQHTKSVIERDLQAILLLHTRKSMLQTLTPFEAYEDGVKGKGSRGTPHLT